LTIFCFSWKNRPGKNSFEFLGFGRPRGASVFVGQGESHKMLADSVVMVMLADYDREERRMSFSVMKRK
jgi:hypothetical protein